MSHAIAGFNHEIEYNRASLFKYLHFNYTVHIFEILLNIYHLKIW